MRKIELYLCFVLSLAIYSPAGAQCPVIKALPFDTNELPSVQPDISHFNNTGQPEGNLFSVSEGRLLQRTIGVGAGSAGYEYSGGLDPTQDVTVEARLSVLNLEIVPPGVSAGVYFQAYDGQNRYSLFFNATGVEVMTPTGKEQHVMDTSDFHFYSMYSPGNSNEVKLFVDGELVLTTEAAAVAFNGFGFGDGVSTLVVNGDADWDFVKVNHGASAIFCDSFE